VRCRWFDDDDNDDDDVTVMMTFTGNSFRHTCKKRSKKNKENVIKRKKRDKNKKNVCKRWIKKHVILYSLFIQFTAIKSNQKQHNEKRQYS